MKMEFVGALLHRPQVLFLDEPTLGLDVTMQKRIRSFVAEYNRRFGATVLLTSHYMADVQALCKRVIVIHHGRILFDGALAELSTAVRLDEDDRGDPRATSTADLSAYGEVLSIDDGRTLLRVARADAPEVTTRLLRDLPVADLTIEDPPIEDVIERVFADARDERDERVAIGGRRLTPAMTTHGADDRPRAARPRSAAGSACTRPRCGSRSLSQIQYRVSNYFYMIGMVAEPVIYLVVWSTVARQQGGEVGGFTPGEFAAYYIVWTLVRNMNIALTPWAWEERVRSGELSGMLLRPVHPIHLRPGRPRRLEGRRDPPLAADRGVPVADLPADVLDRADRRRRLPRRDLGRLRPALDVPAGCSGSSTFWTTRVGPVFDIFFTAELLLSGRLVPMSLMPDWAQRLADFLPFQWTFGFPIEALDRPAADRPAPRRARDAGSCGSRSARSLVAVVWRLAVRRFSAVGG